MTSPSLSSVTSLEGQLLCAVPQLIDPNFQRSVVLILEHQAAGALGLVINDPLPSSICELAESLGLTWQGDSQAQVRLGGPVEPARGWIIHDQQDWDPTAQLVVPGLLLTNSLDSVLAKGHKEFGGSNANVLFLLGYAGWAPGQLEAEIAVGSWVPVPIVAQAGPRIGGEVDGNVGVLPNWLYTTEPTEMWDEALRSIGVDPGRLIAPKSGRRALE